jgi:hypothetical protein
MPFWGGRKLGNTINQDRESDPKLNRIVKRIITSRADDLGAISEAVQYDHYF